MFSGLNKSWALTKFLGLEILGNKYEIIQSRKLSPEMKKEVEECLERCEAYLKDGSYESEFGPVILPDGNQFDGGAQVHGCSLPCIPT